LNIAFYSHYFSPEIGAPSARVHELAHEWISAGHSAHVITCFPNHPGGKVYPGYTAGRYMHERMDGIDVHRHWTYVTPNTGIVKKTLGHLSFLPSAMLFSDRHLPELDVAIGTSPTFFAAGAAAALGRRRRIPFIMDVRDLWPAIFVDLGILRNRQLIGLLERLELALYAEAARVVTVTESFRRNLIQRGVPSGRVITIPNGADLDTWIPGAASEELRRSLGLTGRFVVLYLGNHGISQRLGQVLDAAERLKDRPDIQFLLVGDGPEKEALVTRARGAALPNVQFHAPVDKRGVKDFYALADAGLVPLRDVPLFDTFIPSKMFELMAMARPMVASVRGESADILNRSGAAIVVPPEDGAAIAAAALGLFENRARADAMGRAGREFVAAHYSRRALASTYAGVMSDAINEFRARAR
jgi:hypothetical protein